jgi:glycosyltransferase involved in cell wall biosynthesis
MNGNRYDFCVIITTYNRPKMLSNLLDNIEKEKKNYNILILVFDDSKYLKNIQLIIKMLRKYHCSQIMERKNIYKIFNTTFNLIKKIDSEYFIYLPDDITLINNFFDRSKDTFNSIVDSNKICLSLLTEW